MDYGFKVTVKDREYLRDLAKKLLEYANLPIMEERKKLWYVHNSVEGDRPLVVMETDTFEGDLLPELKCETEAAREIERSLLRDIVNYEIINDDKVISPHFTVNWRIRLREFDTNINVVRAKDTTGHELGYSEEHPIIDLKEDFHKLKPSIFSVDRELTMAWKSFVEELLGDILPVKLKNSSIFWHVTPTAKIVKLMGLETMMYSMVDYPEEMHRLFRFLTDDIMAFIKWQENEGLLTLNNENDYAGAGSYGFTDELPRKPLKDGMVATKDLWINMNSQESVGISPQMYKEFIFPYYCELAGKFGLTYYGCCEPVHSIWEGCISKLPNLRKVSISPWCDEEYMGRALKGGNVIYSRKPSPNFIGVGKTFDEEGFSQHISKTLKAARGCHMEFIFRDVYTLSGDRSKPGKAVAITRRLIEELW